MMRNVKYQISNVKFPMWLPHLTLVVFGIGMYLTFVFTVNALYQPWIAEQAARKAYNEKKATYSPDHQKKLDNLANQMAKTNQRLTNDLALQMEAQGDILEEYQSRQNYKEDARVEKVKYWVTFSHEAVAFQAAKNYVFSLSSEPNMKRDVTPTVNQFKNDLSVLRKKVINSQTMVQELVTP